ncbi:MAG: sugar phosphate isomerase/epimerase, partial [Candidatus Omnitrophica bacterium]|nr:sugar phosphate isomerase/epimerase [Candidatus Omnitrophota bacterium]
TNLNLDGESRALLDNAVSMAHRQEVSDKLVRELRDELSFMLGIFCPDFFVNYKHFMKLGWSFRPLSLKNFADALLSGDFIDLEMLAVLCSYAFMQPVIPVYDNTGKNILVIYVHNPSNMSIFRAHYRKQLYRIFVNLGIVPDKYAAFIEESIFNLSLMNQKSTEKVYYETAGRAQAFFLGMSIVRDYDLLEEADPYKQKAYFTKKINMDVTRINNAQEKYIADILTGMAYHWAVSRAKNPEAKWEKHALDFLRALALARLGGLEGIFFQIINKKGISSSPIKEARNQAKQEKSASFRYSLRQVILHSMELHDINNIVMSISGIVDPWLLINPQEEELNRIFDIAIKWYNYYRILTKQTVKEIEATEDSINNSLAEIKRLSCQIQRLFKELNMNHDFPRAKNISSSPITICLENRPINNGKVLSEIIEIVRQIPGLGLEFILIPEIVDYLNNHPKVGQEIMNLSRKGIPVQVHAPFPLMLNKPEDRNTFHSVLSFAHELGAGIVTVHPGKVVSSFAPYLKLFMGNLKKYDLKLAIENIPESSHSDINALFSHLDDKVFGFCPDIGHANVHRHGAYREHIDKYFDRIETKFMNCHIHDNDGQDDRHWRIGLGEIDFTYFFDLLARVNYSHSLVLEYELNSKKKIHEDIRAIMLAWEFSQLKHILRGMASLNPIFAKNLSAPMSILTRQVKSILGLYPDIVDEHSMVWRDFQSHSYRCLLNKLFMQLLNLPSHVLDPQARKFYIGEKSKAKNKIQEILFYLDYGQFIYADVEI